MEGRPDRLTGPQWVAMCITEPDANAAADSEVELGQYAASADGLLTARDVQFVEMLVAYRRSGGLAKEDEIAWRLRRCRSGVKTHEAGQIAIVFDWGPARWWPRFQFDWETMRIRSSPAEVIVELSHFMDGWAMAMWFALPNLWIGNQRPIDMIDRCAADVIGAARAAQFEGKY